MIASSKAKQSRHNPLVTMSEQHPDARREEGAGPDNLLTQPRVKDETTGDNRYTYKA